MYHNVTRLEGRYNGGSHVCVLAYGIFLSLQVHQAFGFLGLEIN